LPIPRITVGVPVYKGADLIANCLGCLQRQTFGNFEVIISVDGGILKAPLLAAPSWSIRGSVWFFILSDWTGLVISTGSEAGYAGIFLLFNQYISR
jgi:hypothetical protein